MKNILFAYIFNFKVSASLAPNICAKGIQYGSYFAFLWTHGGAFDTAFQLKFSRHFHKKIGVAYILHPPFCFYFGVRCFVNSLPRLIERQDMPSVKWKSLLERRALKKSHNKYYWEKRRKNSAIWTPKNGIPSPPAPAEETGLTVSKVENEINRWPGFCCSASKSHCYGVNSCYGPGVKLMLWW